MINWHKSLPAMLHALYLKGLASAPGLTHANICSLDFRSVTCGDNCNSFSPQLKPPILVLSSQSLLLKYRHI